MFKPIIILLSWVFLISTGLYVYDHRVQISKYISELSSPQELFDDIASKFPIEKFANDLAGKISLPPPLRFNGGSSAANLTASGVVAETNKQRQINGNLPLLTVNAKLTAAASAKIDDMFKNQYFEHISPSGRGPGELAKDANYEYIMIGENLALGNFSGDVDLVTAWMNSPGHRANILKASYMEIGVAVRKGTFEGRTTWLAVQEFGKPLSSCPQVHENLKVQIDVNQKLIDDLNVQIAAKKEEIDNYRPKRGSEYNQKIDEYNALVAQYNALVESTKNLISTYNSEVQAFNACLKQ